MTYYIGLRYSNDGSHNFSGWQQRDIGDTGQYGKRLRWFRLGMFVSRDFEIECSAPKRCNILGAYMVADTEP